ncbi:MAG: hypothetical protein V3W41_12820 [Planctomycetota bacterium]
MSPRDRINATIKTLAELYDTLELFTLDDSLKEQSDMCRKYAEQRQRAVAEALAHMELARDRCRSEPPWGEDTIPLAV